MIKYIDGDPRKGILYDWKKIRKEYKKLHCPKDVFYPLKCDWDRARFSLTMSDRSRGKTTNPLLVCLLMYRDYGTTPHYLRMSKDDTRPMIMQDMFETIREYGYIERIFGDEFNDLDYYGKRWTLLKRDENGTVLHAADRPALVCFGLDEQQGLKSSYNAPRGDAIILDEFIEETYRYNSFFRFKNLLKTIIRDRKSAVCWMLANSTDVNSPWFDDMMIRDDINNLEWGKPVYVQALDGVNYHIDVLPPDQSIQRQEVNRLYFGKGNPKLASITGDQMWSTEDYPHIPPFKKDEPETVYGHLYLEHAGKLVRLILVSREIGLAVHVVRANRIYDDSWVLTLGDITDKRYLYGPGPKDTIIQTYWQLYKANRWYYSSNTEGALIKSYIKTMRIKERGII